MSAEIIYYVVGMISGSIATLGVIWMRRQPAIPTKRRHMKRRSVELETRPNRRITPAPAQSFDEGNTHQ